MGRRDIGNQPVAASSSVPRLRCARVVVDIMHDFLDQIRDPVIELHRDVTVQTAEVDGETGCRAQGIERREDKEGAGAHFA